MKKLLLSLALVAAASALQAATVAYSYVPDGAPELAVGFPNASFYQAAMRVNDASLSGYDITSLSFRLNVDPAKVASCQAWLSKRLSTTGALETIQTADATVAADGTASATFAQPYTLAGANVYAGYTLTLTEPVENPVIVAEIPETYGFYLRTEDTGAWERMGSNYSLYLDVNFSGDFPALGAELSYVSEINAVVGKDAACQATVTNRGSEAVESITYSYDFNGLKGTAEQAFSPAISPKYGSMATFEIPVPACDASGSYEAAFQIQKVNGKDMASEPVSTPYAVISYFPKNRPLMEEYTGTWCGNCPRGAAALDEMSHTLGQDFVGVALHFSQGDPMQVLADSYGASGYPDARINRSLQVDPYFGSKTTNLDQYPLYVQTDYEQVARQFTPVEILAKAEWADADKTEITLTTTSIFVKAPGSETYRVGYILVQDNLAAPEDTSESSAWAQHNYFSNDGLPEDMEVNPYAAMPGLKWYTEQPEVITDAVYQHVAIYYPFFNGVPDSLKDVEIDTPIDNVYKIKLSDANSVYGQNLVRDKDDLHVVAFVINTSRSTIANSISCPVDGQVYGAVEEIRPEAVAVASEWYTLQGTRLQQPADKGLFIRLDRYSDGSAKACKIAR